MNTITEIPFDITPLPNVPLVIAVTGRAGTGKTTVVNILQHMLRVEGHSVERISVPLSGYDACFKRSLGNYVRFLYDKEGIRQEIINEIKKGKDQYGNDYLIEDMIGVISKAKLNKNNILFIESWRATDNYELLKERLRGLYPDGFNLLLIDIISDRNLRKELEKNPEEQKVKNWPKHRIIRVLNTAQTTYMMLAMNLMQIHDKELRPYLPNH